MLKDKPTIHVLTFGQFRSPELFIKVLGRYASDNHFDYKVFGHTWDDEFVSRGSNYLNAWDSLKISDPTKVILRNSLIDKHEDMINRHPKEWNGQIYPVIENLIMMVNSIYELIIHYSESVLDFEQPQMILFMRTDAAFDYMLDHRLFDIKDDGIIYPIGFKWTFFEVLFHSFAFTPGAFCCLDRLAQSGQEIFIQSIENAMSQFDYGGLSGERMLAALFLYLVVTNNKNISLYPMASFISDRVVRLVDDSRTRENFYTMQQPFVENGWSINEVIEKKKISFYQCFMKLAPIDKSIRPFPSRFYETNYYLVDPSNGELKLTF